MENFILILMLMHEPMKKKMKEANLVPTFGKPKWPVLYTYRQES